MELFQFECIGFDLYRALPATHIYWTKKRHVLLIFVDLRTVLLERHKHFVFTQERKRNFIEQIASIVMNIFIFFKRKSQIFIL